VKAVGREEMVEFAKEAAGLADDTIELPEEGPDVDREITELVGFLLAPI
jgi:hypothetical protein